MRGGRGLCVRVQVLFCQNQQFQSELKHVRTSDGGDERKPSPASSQQESRLFVSFKCYDFVRLR